MTKSLEMKDKLHSILNFIISSAEENGYPPTVREIRDAFDISSTSSVHYYIKKLQKSGKLSVDKNKSRAIGIAAKEIQPKDTVKVPYIGCVPAGVPKLAYSEDLDVFYLPKDLFYAGGELFMLDVVGSSMINDGILDGDKIIVRSQPTANNGEIVVARIDEENCTVKRFYKEEGRVKLAPANDNMKPIYSDSVVILGKVVGLIRNI
ncbi:MAG: transcriptional repressor LexA [Christensenellales bacterium]|jgi:repressor LexA